LAIAAPWRENNSHLEMISGGRYENTYMWHVLAGFVLSLTGMAQQGSAAILPQEEVGVWSVGNVAQPGRSG